MPKIAALTRNGPSIMLRVQCKNDLFLKKVKVYFGAQKVLQALFCIPAFFVFGTEKVLFQKTSNGRWWGRRWYAKFDVFVKFATFIKFDIFIKFDKFIKFDDFVKI